MDEGWEGFPFTPIDLEWQDQANCRGSDSDLFFLERGKSSQSAKVICRECQVREECLEFAINTGQRFGVWGGLSERERRRVRRERQIPLVRAHYTSVIADHQSDWSRRQRRTG
ncbi:MAG: WhiB family transcriptional regulator [Candidatus Colwellbacteria bacterium]|nr:WhiB family transcriptional regulator [Candidatus Colwellbacteria bacterium]